MSGSKLDSVGVGIGIGGVSAAMSFEFLSNGLTLSRISRRWGFRSRTTSTISSSSLPSSSSYSPKMSPSASLMSTSSSCPPSAGISSPSCEQSNKTGFTSHRWSPRPRINRLRMLYFWVGLLNAMQAIEIIWFKNLNNWSLLFTMSAGITAF